MAPEPEPIPGPHPDPHAPVAYTPPPNATDAHCHIFGPAATFPFAPARAYPPPDAGIDDFEALQSRLGLTRAVFVQASCHGTDNAAMVDALVRGGGRYAGVAMIDESFSDAAIADLHAVGVRGTRFNFVAHLGGAPDLARVNAVIARVAPLGWHVELHLDAHDIATYRGFLDALPVPYIIDHMGRVEARLGLEQPAFRLLLELMRDERTWVKASGAERVSSQGRPYHDAIPFARALIDAAPDRVLWGTDFPHPNVKEMPNDGEQVNLFAAICPDEGLRRKILVDNPNTLYWPEEARA